MNNPNQINPTQLNLLLKAAAKQLNTDPELLRQQLEQGDLQSLNANLSAQMQQQINQTLSDPKELRRVLSQTDLNQLLKNLR